jgi:hypothetical protein
VALNAGTATAIRGADATITVTGNSVGVTASAWITGTGLATAMAQSHFTALIQGYSATLITTLRGQIPYGSATSALSNTALATAQGAVQQANAYAAAIVTHITSNAVVPATGLLDHGGGTCSGSTTVT